MSSARKGRIALEVGGSDSSSSLVLVLFVDFGDVVVGDLVSLLVFDSPEGEVNGDLLVLSFAVVVVVVVVVAAVLGAWMEIRGMNSRF